MSEAERAQRLAVHLTALAGVTMNAKAEKLIAEALQSARQEGIEQAAKVADHRTGVWKNGERGPCSMSLQEECEDIAAAIRTLKDGNEGEG